MAKWKYTLKSGIELRDAIDREDYSDVLDILKVCFAEINKVMPQYYSKDDLEEDLFEVEDYRDTLENYEEYNMSYDDACDNINYLLNKLYDICDDLRIWIDL